LLNNKIKAALVEFTKITTKAAEIKILISSKNYFFQNAGVKSSKTVKSSRRPNNIINDRNHLAKTGK